MPQRHGKGQRARTERPVVDRESNNRDCVSCAFSLANSWTGCVGLTRKTTDVFLRFTLLIGTLEQVVVALVAVQDSMVSTRSQPASPRPQRTCCARSNACRRFNAYRSASDIWSRLFAGGAEGAAAATPDDRSQSHTHHPCELASSTPAAAGRAVPAVQGASFCGTSPSPCPLPIAFSMPCAALICVTAPLHQIERRRARGRHRIRAVVWSCAAAHHNTAHVCGRRATGRGRGRGSGAGAGKP
jgi:hypothetical protein